MACANFSVVLNGTQVAFNSNSTLADNPTLFSASLWIKTTTNNGSITEIIGKRQVPAPHRGWDMFLLNGKIGFELNGATNVFTVQGTTVSSDGNWHNIVVTWDATSTAVINIYKDGILDATGTAGATIGSISSTNDVYLSDGLGLFAPLTGSLVGVRLWNVILTSGDASTIAAGGDPSTSPIAYWKMLEGAGVILNDFTGNGNTMAFNNPITWSTDTPSALGPCTNAKIDSSMNLVF